MVGELVFEANRKICMKYCDVVKEKLWVNNRRGSKWLFPVFLDTVNFWDTFEC